MDEAPLPFLLFSLTLLLVLYNCSAKDNTTVTPTQFITDLQTLTSSGEIFKLGFFSPLNSSNRYVGIWYNKIPVQTIVWVANRDNPLKDSSGILRITNDGNLVLLDGGGSVFWTTNVSNIASNNSIAELLDSGNLVLRQENTDRRILWQSFEDPYNTFLPLMMLGANRRTGKTLMLTSRKGESDPSSGIFCAGLELKDIPQIVIWKRSERHWRSGPWNNRIFIGISTMYSVYSDGFSIIRDVLEDTLYLTFDYFNKSSFTRFVLDHRGELVEERCDEGGDGWYRFFSTKDNDECDVYGKCGPFGSCNILDSPICSCLRGFKPKSEDEWSKGNWSGGCVRKTELQCEGNRNSTSISSSNNKGKNKEDGFLKLEMMKVPDFANWRLAVPKDAKECEQECIRNCSCLAYSYDSGVGCFIWGGSLVDIQKFSRGAGVDLHIRVAYSELDGKKNSKVIIILTVLIGTFTASVCAYFCWRWMAKQRESSNTNMLGDNADADLKFFKFEKLAIATDQFGEANKLGEGGFGSVYKGMFKDGQEIAVKRLSKGSGQGIQEFKNEVLVISKLQHSGYMSPEYAMEGLFSEKSDVYSFGVLLLEIVGRKRNNSLQHLELPLSLLGYAWQLWNENNMQSLIDSTVLSEPFLEQILRCIHVGLLCTRICKGQTNYVYNTFHAYK
ncbi:Protein kinase domain [Macleaya cordata]|uniref:non-specific serine/threonine protein kinase n=1 Tax=Macleaya cordata TaxID=56857 RepID=A0A200QQN4_MACCD|nr:Protein kinase domain [Macleaya cordata]